MSEKECKHGGEQIIYQSKTRRVWLCNSREKTDREIELEDENKELKAYAHHLGNCVWNEAGDDCSCGLFKLLESEK